MTERTSGGGNTPLWNLRMDKALWRRFGRAAAKNGTNRTAVLRQFVMWFVHEPGASVPSRPETPTPEIPGDTE